MSQPPTPQEFKRALQKMKVGKAPGDDGVTVEILKWAPPSIIDKVITITQQIWQTTTRADPQELVDHWPAEWLTATVIPLWKMKHPKTCKQNWRGVTLLSIGSKLIARIVANRVQTFSESFMDEQQQCFRRNRGVDDVLQESIGVSPRKLSVPGVPKMFTSHCTTSRKRIPIIATHYGSYYSVGGYRPNLSTRVRVYIILLDSTLGWRESFLGTMRRTGG